MLSKYLNILKAISLSLFIPLIINPQTGNVRFEHFSVEQGLSQSTIYSIYQDSRGFLWLGTADGLNRYDGYKFIIYKHVPSDSLSISANRIYSVQEDRAGDLWIGTYGGGLNKFIRNKNSFIHFKSDPNNKSSLSNDKVVSIFIDHSDILWVGTEGGGLNRFDIKTENFIHYNHNPYDQSSLSNDNVRVIYEDKKGDLWIGTGDGLNMLDRANEQFIHYKHNINDPASISNNEILSIHEDKSGNLWIGTGGGGLNKFVRKSGKFIHYKFNPANPNSISANRVFSVTEDNSGILWIGTIGGGLNRFDKEKNQFAHYNLDPEDPWSLSSSGVFSVYNDNSGVLWIGTYNGGLNKLDLSKKRFKYFTHNSNESASLSDKRVYSFYEDKTGDIWIGSGKGLNKFNKTNGTFIRYNHNPESVNSLNADQVLSISEDKYGNLCIGTYGGGLNILDKERKRFVHYKHEPNNSFSLSDNRIFSVLEDNDGFLWIGTDGGGLNKFDREKNQFIHYKNSLEDKSSLSANRVFVIYEDKSGTIWIGTDGGGLNKFDKEKNQFVHYLHNPKDTLSLSNNSVFSILEDKSGNLWVGTYGGGLNKFDVQKKIFRQYRETDGLPNEVIYGILEDGNGKIWLSTNKGLAVFDPKTEKFRSYDVKDGLQSDEFNQGAYFKTQKNALLFGGINGFNFFYPDSLQDNNHIPNIVITDFQVFNKSVSVPLNESIKSPLLSTSISEAKEIKLSYEENVISFEFSALDYQTPEKNRYAYFMDGFDKDWNYTDASRRFVTYTNLDPGEYIFKVKGSNNDGIWNDAGTSVRLIISPPFWATWWAYSIYALLGFGILYSLRRFEHNRTKLKAQVKLDEMKLKEREETDKLKSRFFANISHEFRTPLTLILGPAEKINHDSSKEEIQKQLSVIKRNANRLLILINQLLDLSKIEAGKLELKAQKGNIVSFIKGITMSFESVAEAKDIAISVKASSDEIELYFDKEKMTKIIMNLLSNAFKFTKDEGRIIVTISETNTNSIQIKVKDSGIGISKDELSKLFDRFYQVDSSHTREHEGTGIGLALTKELVELHRGTITVDSELSDYGLAKSGWTEFTISLPMGKNHLKDYEVIEAEKPIWDHILVDKEDFIRSRVEENDEPEIGEDKNIVLIVEDNADVREFIKDSLSDNFHIEEASNGEQGRRKAEKIIPDIIISDIMMPKMDGNELTRILKKEEKTSHIPIILLTAKSEQESRLEGLETGADDYLTKPFDTKELRIRIKNLIENRRNLQEKYSRADFTPVKRAKEKKLNNLEEQFMYKVTEVIANHLSEEEFSIEQFGKEVGMSRVQLHRKLKALSGKSASNYLRSVRLSKAKKLIEEQKGNISEIAYSVGFSSPAYFTRCFKEEFGHPPSDFKV